MSTCWYLPNRKKSVMTTSQADADWYNMCESALYLSTGHSYKKWDNLKLVFAYNMCEDLCKYIAMNQFEDTQFGWGEPSIIYKELKEIAFFFVLLKEAQRERERYLSGYLSRWSDSNEKLYNLLPVKKYRGKYIWEQVD